MKILIASILIIFLSLNTVSAQIQLEQTTVDTSTIITGLDIPWEILWGPDDQLWITERFGRVSRINPETGQQDIILDISNTVHQNSESGLLGMVMHPDFSTHPYVYLAFTYKPGASILERIVRYEYSGGQLVNEFILLDNIAGNTNHDGCRLIITPDYKLFITTGDAQNQQSAQNLESLSGKVLRLNLDGSVPDDNPWPGNPVYSFGHRNPQGLFLAPNGILYSSEHGPTTDDELNIIEAGRNYGWPAVHGFCNLPAEITFCLDNNVREPLVAWTPTIATSDIIYYDHPSIPEWQGHILMTTLKNKRLYVLELDETGASVTGQTEYFYNLWGRLRDICMAPDGSLYLATNGPDWNNSQPFTHSIVKVWNPEYIASSASANTVQNSVKLFPNPVKNLVHILVGPAMIGQKIRFISGGGITVFEQQIDSTFTSIPIHALNNGTYIVLIGGRDNPIFSAKMVILKED
jgi:glucose/arabinose dehydrogenase